MRFTDLAIKNLPAPAQGQKTYFDDSLPGFRIKVGSEIVHSANPEAAPVYHDRPIWARIAPEGARASQVSSLAN